MITIVQSLVVKQSTKPTRMPILMKFTFLWKIKKIEN